MMRLIYLSTKFRKTIKIAGLAALFCFFAFLAWAATLSENSKPSSLGAANYYELKPNPYLISLGVKGYQQTDGATCGPAAVMSLMHWYKMLDGSLLTRETEMRIAREMGTGAIDSPRPGTTPEQMAAWLENNGFTVKWGTDGDLNMLRENLSRGVPVLVEWIDWGGHWVVATGYYARSESPPKGPDTIFFADPAVHWSSDNNPDGITSFSALRFADMWFDAQHYKPGKVVRNIYIVAVPRVCRQ